MIKLLKTCTFTSNTRFSYVIKILPVILKSMIIFK